MRPPRFSGQRCSCRLGPGLEGLDGAVLVSKKEEAPETIRTEHHGEELNSKQFSA